MVQICKNATACPTYLGPFDKSSRKCCRKVFISDPSPPKKKDFFFWGGVLFFGFFHEVLRWGHKILHADSKGLIGPSSRILENLFFFKKCQQTRCFNFLGSCPTSFLFSTNAKYRCYFLFPKMKSIDLCFLKFLGY